MGGSDFLNLVSLSKRIVKNIIKDLSFLERKTLVIERGAFNFKVALVSFQDNRIKIEKFFLADRTEKEEALISSVKESIPQENSGNIEGVCLLPEYKFLSRRFSLPRIPYSEIESALRFQLKDEIAWPLENIHFLYTLIEEKTEEGTPFIEVMVLAIQLEEIEKIRDFFRKIGVACFRITTLPFSLFNILGEETLGQNFGVLDIGATCASLILFKDSKLSFLRNISWGGEQLSISIEKALGLKLSSQKMALIKRNWQDESQISPQEREVILPLIRTYFEKLSTEIKHSFDYYNLEYGETFPPRLYLTGGGSLLGGLKEWLERSLNKEILPLPLSKSLASELINNLKEEEKVFWLPLLSAALEKKYNFLPPGLRPKRFERLEVIFLRILSLVITSLLGMNIFLVSLKLRDYKARLNNARLHLGTLENIRVLKKKLTKESEIFNRLSNLYIPGDYIMKAISNCIPARIILESLDINLGEKSVFSQGKIFLVRDAEEVLAGYVRNLEKVGIFKEVEVREIVKSTDSINFQMSWRLSL